ncbi:hypothetical protein [Caballeronia concitans]|uniref:Uncharacterized protein n=1 Tax=Caballeronia concitans TaxID=1777133 RepID=A0A658R4Z7_9BURK|nr:hypothetical protein [Caballeronia concitans]SAL51434.1 hypothetical protein AWB72_05448 [Caballeronia concitans]
MDTWKKLLFMIIFASWMVISFAQPNISVVSVSIPPRNTWCAQTQIRSSDADSLDKYAATLQQALRKLDSTLISANARASGTPFLGGYTKLEGKDEGGKLLKTLSLDVCTVVSTSLPSPTTPDVTLHIEPQSNAIVTVCARASSDSCVADLRQAVAQQYPQLSIDEIGTWNWRMVSAKGSTVSEQNARDALTDSTSRPITLNPSTVVSGDISVPDPHVFRPFLSGSGNVTVTQFFPTDWVLVAIFPPPLPAAAAGH